MRARGWVLAVPLTFVGVFFVVPVVAVVWTGLRPHGAWDLTPAGDVLGSLRTWRVLGFTALQATLSAAVTLALALPASYVIARFTFPGRGLLRAGVVIPFVLPTVVVGVAFLGILGPRGLLGVDLTGTMVALLAAHAFLNFAVVVRTVGSLLAQLDPRQEEAARMLGASRWSAFRTVTWPLVQPAVVASAVIVFLFCFTSFGVVQVLGAGRLRTLEVEIYRATAVRLDLAAAAALAVLQLVAVLSVIVVLDRVQRRREVQQRLVPVDEVARPARTAGERVAVGVTATLTAVLLAAPVVVLVARSFRTPQGWSLDYWRALFTDTGSTAFVDPLRAVATSLSTACVAAAIAVTVGGLAAFALARRGRGPLASGTDALLVLPLGTSAVTVGLGMFLALDAPPLDLRDSWWLVPIAQALVAVPFVVRILTPVLRSFDDRLLDAAALLGARPARARRTVLLPALVPPLVVSIAFAFAISIGEFGATVFLARADRPTLPVAIVRLLGRPGDLNLGQAYAASALLLIVTLVVVALADRVRVGRLGEF